MASWTINGTTTSSTYWKARAIVTEVSQSIANNTTQLKVDFQLGRDVVSSYLYSYNTNWYINIGSNGSGTQTITTWDWDPATAGTWKTIATRTVTVTHNADGTMKNLAVSCRWYNTGVTPSEATVSGTVNLTTIPRATTPSVPSSVTMGSATTITLPRASSSFTHYLTYAFGDTGGVITNAAGASISYTFPLSLAWQVPSSTSGTCSLTCHTYNGTRDPAHPTQNLIGSKTITFPLKVPASIVPTISGVVISEAVANLGSPPYVRNKSKLNIKTTAAGASGSTISKYAVSVGSASYSGSNVTTPVLTTAGTVTVKVTVTDSRGRTATNSQSVTVVADTPTTPTVSGTATMGSSYTITLPRVAGSNYTHNLTYTFGGASGTIRNGATTSYSWAVPITLANQVPSATSGQGTITCKTYSGSTLIGTTTVQFTAQVPASVVPTISSVALSEGNAAVTTAGFTVYVQGKSRLRIVTSATSSYNGYITSIKATVSGIGTYTGSTVTTDWLKNSGNVTVSVTVTDSRGRTATSATQTINVVAYVAPSGTVSGVRATDAGTQSNAGTRLLYSATYRISSVSGQNVPSFALQYKQSSASSWTTIRTATTLTGTYTNVLAPDTVQLNVDSSYNLRINITDSFGTVTVYAADISTGFTTMDFLADGKGIALGKAAETSNLFECDFDAKFLNGLFDGDGNDVDAIRHPVLIANGSNLNNYDASGIYYQGSSANTSNMSNIPEKLAFWMTVEKTGSAGWTTQRILYPTNGHEYVRYYSSWSTPAAWTDWVMMGGIDCIVEQGTSGVWRYRKWQSGIAECWGTSSVNAPTKNLRTASTSGAPLFYSDLSYLTLPSIFTSITSVDASISTTDTTYHLAYIVLIHPFSTTQIGYRMVNLTQTETSYARNLYAHVFGTWK